LYLALYPRFGDQQIITTEADGAVAVLTADLDGDGEKDVLSSSECESSVAWHENTDGQGTFGSQYVIGTVAAQLPDQIRWLYAGDVDDDGDLDVLCGFDCKIEWYENFRPEPGDAKRDLQFDQLDIAQVLQSAKYLTGEAETWDQGDWNEDGLFDQKDITLALQTDNYLQAPYAALAADAVFSESE
jgi:hypothetical protein